MTTPSISTRTATTGSLTVMRCACVPGDAMRSLYDRGAPPRSGEHLRPAVRRSSVEDLGDGAGGNRLAALADGEPEAHFHCDCLAQLDGHGGGVTGHDHLGP